MRRVAKFFSSPIFVMVVGLIFAKAAEFVSRPLISQNYNLDEFGFFMYTISVAWLFAAAGQFAFNTSLVHFVARSETRVLHDIHLGVTFFGVFVIIIIITLLFFGVRLSGYEFRSMGRATTELPVYVLLLAVAFVCYEIFSAFYQGLRAFNKFSLLNYFVPYGIRLLAIYFSIALSLTLVQMGELLAALLLIPVVILMLVKVKAWKSLVGEVKKYTSVLNDFISIIKFGLPMYFMRLVDVSKDHGVIILVMMLGGAQDVAVFSASAALGQVLVLPILLLNQMTMPRYARLYAIDSIGANASLYNGVTILSRIILLPALLIYILFGEKLLITVFGIDYGQGEMVLQIISLGVISEVVWGLSGAPLQMSGNAHVLTKIHLYSIVAGAIVAILLLNFVLPSIAFAVGLAIYKCFAQYWASTHLDKIMSNNSHVFLKVLVTMLLVALIVAQDKLSAFSWGVELKMLVVVSSVLTSLFLFVAYIKNGKFSVLKI